MVGRHNRWLLPLLCQWGTNIYIWRREWTLGHAPWKSLCKDFWNLSQFDWRILSWSPKRFDRLPIWQHCISILQGRFRSKRWRILGHSKRLVLKRLSHLWRFIAWSNLWWRGIKFCSLLLNHQPCWIWWNKASQDQKLLECLLMGRCLVFRRWMLGTKSSS